MEAARYREAANRQLRKAEARCNTLQNASYTIQEAAARRTDRMKDRARIRHVEELERIKQLRKRISKVRLKRLEAEEERRQRREAIEEKAAGEKDAEPEKVRENNLE